MRIVFLSIIISVFYAVLKQKYKTNMYRLFLVLNVLLTIIIFIKHMLHSSNLDSVFDSTATFKSFILSTGKNGMFVFTLIQFLQVIFLPIPSLIITLTGVAIYGPIIASVLCSVGILLGSFTSFMLGKIWGYKIANWIAGEKNAKKYADLLNAKGRFFLIIAFLLPLFPDDILCLVAGITSMKFKTFFVIASITRPIGVIFMSYFGGGYIIPFVGWGLYVWPFLLAFIIVAVVVIYKKQSQIEQYILNMLDKIKQKRKKLV